MISNWHDAVPVVDVPRHVVLHVTRPTFDELVRTFTAAGYPHFCQPDLIDFNGVAITPIPHGVSQQDSTTPAASPGRDRGGSSSDSPLE